MPENSIPVEYRIKDEVFIPFNTNEAWRYKLFKNRFALGRRIQGDLGG